jgi:integrase
MDGAGSWVVEFYDLLRPMSGDLGIEGLAGLADRARRNGARHGTPVLLRSDGWVDPRLNLFFRTRPMTGARPRTWRRYAFTLKVWLTFLDTFGISWDQASCEDVDAFMDWRLTDTRNPDRVAAPTFDADRAALNTFYTWAGRTYGVFNPVPTVGPVTGRTRSRDPGRPAGSTRRQVKWLLRPAFEQWRDVGLRGYRFDGLRSSTWRGLAEDRDAAFVDGLYGTGLRLSEWASVLDVEIPQAAAGRFPRAWLARACIKGAREGREYFVPSAILKAVAGYCDPLEGSRIEALERARRAGRYERVAGKRIVTGYSRRGRVLHVLSGSGTEPVALDALGPEERRLLFRNTPQGLEPLALWLSVDGMPKHAESWEDTFAAANARIEREWLRAGGVGEVELWARPHMCRHSFALKWFSVLSVVWDPMLEGFTTEEQRDLRDQFGDVWFQLATLLGHADPSTTKEHYLEPFNRLQVDYLMSLLDGEERTAIDAFVRAVATAGGRTLGPVGLVARAGEQGGS